MSKPTFLATSFVGVISLVLVFAGGAGAAVADSGSASAIRGLATGGVSELSVTAAAAACTVVQVTGVTPSAPSRRSAQGVLGTTSADLASYAAKVNQIRVANCLNPIPLANFRYDACMETRLFWMAESPAVSPADAWGHIGVTRIDGVPSVGCDGNLAGGTGNTGATVAQKWWDSVSHRNSVYRPTFTGSTANVCIMLAMTHGGNGDAVSFPRAASRWLTC